MVVQSRLNSKALDRLQSWRGLAPHNIQRTILQEPTVNTPFLGFLSTSTLAERLRTSLFQEMGHDR